MRKVVDENLILKLAVAGLRLDFTNLEEGAADECELLPERESGMLLTTFCDGIQEILERTWIFGEGAKLYSEKGLGGKRKPLPLRPAIVHSSQGLANHKEDAHFVSGISFVSNVLPHAHCQCRILSAIYIYARAPYQTQLSIRPQSRPTSAVSFPPDW